MSSGAKRRRPGKRERETALPAAIRAVRNAKMDATRQVMAALKEEQHLARGYGRSSANRDKLKGGTGSVGFYGGRGYGSPKGPTGPLTEDKLGRMTPDQATPRNTGAYVPRPNGPTSTRFAEDTFPVEKPSLTVERRASKRERFKVIGRVQVRLPDPAKR